MLDFNRWDEQFVNRLLNPKYREFHIPTLRRARNTAFLLICVLGALFILIVLRDVIVDEMSSILGLYAFMLLMFFAIAFNMDTTLKAFLVCEKLKVTVPAEAQESEDEATWAAESKRTKIVRLGVLVLVLMAGIIGFLLVSLGR